MKKLMFFLLLLSLILLSACEANTDSDVVLPSTAPTEVGTPPPAITIPTPTPTAKESPTPTFKLPPTSEGEFEQQTLIRYEVENPEGCYIVEIWHMEYVDPPEGGLWTTTYYGGMDMVVLAEDGKVLDRVCLNDYFDGETLGVPTNFAAGKELYSAAYKLNNYWADYNGDGRLDIAIPASFSSGRHIILTIDENGKVVELPVEGGYLVQYGTLANVMSGLWEEPLWWHEGNVLWGIGDMAFEIIEGFPAQVDFEYIDAYLWDGEKFAPSGLGIEKFIDEYSRQTR
ncbi:hypothetical protein LJC32_02060 [Oscillospiraceae bacterium OttesenSCG-928-F05]|nr:hypothetical protein [Oscillospiraceae bacterium OttesenSCG-928-F05]